MKTTLICTSLGIFLLFAVSCDGPTVKSPDGSLVVTVSERGFVAARGSATQTVSFEGGAFKASSPGAVRESYALTSGSRARCDALYTTRTFTFGGFTMDMRVCDYGVAYRFRGEEPPTSYIVPGGRRRWMGRYSFAAYETFFPLDTAAREGKWVYPALLEYGDGMFGLIGEAGVDRGQSCSMLETVPGGDGEYRIAVTDKDVHMGTSPWRFVMMGSLREIVQSTLVTDLSAPCRLEDTSWISPGMSSWIYWAYNHGSKDYGIITRYIDLAARMGWPYCLVDWEWPQMGGGKTIEDVIAYARDKGVKINLWYNSGTSWTGEGAAQPVDRLLTKESREREFSYLEGLGVSGVKVDFFSEDDVKTVNYYMDILEDAARHHLLVDFHGCTVPRGWQRTYPNLMTMEAVLGAEWYNNGPGLTDRAASHNATLPFTRNVMGPMDYTPCTFSDSQNPHITTPSHELALPILFQSSLQHMADRPESYLTQPARVVDLLRSLPATWDETVLLDGYPGEFVVMARRSAGRWYVCGINGTDTGRVLDVDLSPLGNRTGPVTLLTDGPDGKTIGTIDTDSPRLEVDCLPRGGFVAYFSM